MKKFAFGFLSAVLAGISSLVGSHATEVQAADDKFIVVASTTSTQNSGLFDYILPKFTAETGVGVRVVAVGTGQAIRLARSGDADVLLVHHRPSEEKFVAQGFGVERLDVMYNDFVLVGPKNDPAGIRDVTDVATALAQISEGEAVFVSRGDDSGTHKKELGLWRAAGVDAAAASGSWYRESGSGMGATLNTAAAMSGYTLSDRGTWLSFKNRGNLKVLVEGDERLFNPYGVVLVDKKRHPHVKTELGQRFVDWLVSPAGQAAIAEFKVDGEPLFKPSAVPRS